MWESCKVGMLKKNKECYVFNAFQTFLEAIKIQTVKSKHCTEWPTLRGL